MEVGINWFREVISYGGYNVKVRKVTSKLCFLVEIRVYYLRK